MLLLTTDNQADQAISPSWISGRSGHIVRIWLMMWLMALSIPVMAQEISPSGSATYCYGDSILLSTVDTGTNYQWYRNDIPIPGATTCTFYVSENGYYHVTFESGPDVYELDSVVVSGEYCMDLGDRGPGGVGDSASNRVWLRASDINGLSDGEKLTAAWPDTSGHGLDASQAVPAYQPVYRSGALNGEAAVQFDGVTTFLRDAHSYDVRTVFVVYRVNSLLQDPSMLGQLWGNYGDAVHVAADARPGNINGFSFDGTGSTQARYGLNGAGYGTLESNANYDPWSYDSVQVVAAEFAAGQTVTEQVLGSLAPEWTVGEHQFGGEIGEVIVYNAALNTAQKVIVENYLSSRFSIDIASNGRDYFGFESTHDHDLAGIGRENLSNYHARSFSGNILGLSGPDDMDDGEYLLVAHDGEAVSGWSDQELADTAVHLQRIEREWRVDETGDLGGVTLSVDTSLFAARPAGYDRFVLLVDADGDFTSGAAVYEMESVQGDSIYEVPGIDLESGDYITVGVVQPELQFSSGTAYGFENEDAILDYFLNYIPLEDVTFRYETVDGSAVSPANYAGVSPAVEVTIPAGTQSGQLTIGVVNNTVVEASRSFEAVLSDPPAGVNLGSDDRLTYTIHDDDNPRKIYFESAATLSPEGFSSVDVVVQITPSEFDEVNTTTVDYEVTGGTAAGGGEDYTLAAGTVSIPPYHVSETFTLTVVDDPLDEPDETILITLSNPTNSSLSSTEPIEHLFTIEDNDDPPLVRFGESGSDQDESSGSFTIPVELSAASSQDIAVDYVISGTADGADHDLVDGSLVIPAGVLSASIDGNLADDGEVEPAETLVLTLQDPPVNGSVGSPDTYTLTINDNDAGMGFTGPGGVGDSLINKLWLAADHITGLSDGADLSVAWPDTSGNEFDASQSNAANRPSYYESVINGMPVVRFDGSAEDDYLDDPHGYNARTVLAVYRVDASLQDGGELGQLWGNYDEGVHVAVDPRGGNERGWSFDGDGDENTHGRYALFGDSYGSYVEDDNTSQWSYDDFQLVTVEFETTREITRQVIGSLVPPFSVGEHHFGGDLAEIIVYNTTLNNTQRILVENYLAAKYDLALAGGVDRYDFEAGNHYDVAGIGRVSTEDYHLAAQSSGILKVSDAASLSDGDFLLFGHDSGLVDSWTDTEPPADTLKRLEREWVFDETGETGEVLVSIDTSRLGEIPDGHQGYWLILDDDGDFTAGASPVQLTLSGDSYEARVDVSEGTYLTVGIRAPYVSFEREVSAASEAAGEAEIVVTLSDILPVDVTVDFAITGGTATEGAGNDFTAVSSPITIAAGTRQDTIVLTINNDGVMETEETVVLDITGVSAEASTGESLQHVFTISDNDNDGFTGPGGVGDSLINSLWLTGEAISASDGDPVITWPDTSGNSHDAINLAPGREPDFIQDGISGLPVVQFDDVNQEYLGNNLSLDINSSDNATVFIVARNTTGNDQDNTGLFIGQSPGTGGSVRHYGLEYEGTVRFNNGNRIFADGFTRDDWKLGTWRNTAGASYGEYEFFVDGVSQSQVSSNNSGNIPGTSDDLFYIGAGLGTGTGFLEDRYFNGEIAEVIAYHYELNDAQRVIVENYLASKFHPVFTIAADHYRFDEHFGNEVAGIGRLDLANFHTTSQSGGVIRFSNASGLDDDEFLFFGHDNSSMSSWSSTGTPDDSVRILPRRWRLDETGDPGNCIVQLDTALLPTKPAGYVAYSLWLDSDGDFSSGAVRVPLERNGDVYEATGLDLTDG